ncbi:MAG: ankyrin repeat domain-containing protein [Nevskiaceae bacterium]|jgi:ankyrin repeat protein|nr:ankyrin repeat domain-containing protein [Nevskiaceae bacterium]
MTADIFSVVRKGDLGQLKAFVSSDNINGRDESGSSLLHVAIAFRHDDAALYLISSGIELNAQSKDGKTALSYAAVYQNEPVARMLIERGADINLADNFGNGPLWHALQSSRKDYNLFECILNSGADPTVKNKVGKSVADAVNSRGDETLLSLLKRAQ